LSVDQNVGVEQQSAYQTLFSRGNAVRLAPQRSKIRQIVTVLPYAGCFSHNHVAGNVAQRVLFLFGKINLIVASARLAADSSLQVRISDQIFVLKPALEVAVG